MGYEGTRFSSAMPRPQQKSSRHSDSKHGSSALTKQQKSRKSHYVELSLSHDCERKTTEEIFGSTGLV